MQQPERGSVTLKHWQKKSPAWHPIKKRAQRLLEEILMRVGSPACWMWILALHHLHPLDQRCQT